MAWTSSISLTRFAKAVQYGVGVGSGPRADCSRAALAVWIRKLNVSTSRVVDDSTPPSADEVMLDWLVTSVRFDWTPREVMVWLFPIFGDMLFQMISDIDVKG